MPKKLNIVVVTAGDWDKPPVSLGYIKAFLEKQPGLKKQVEMTFVDPPVKGSFDGLLPVIKPLSPDMVTFTPHEDWDNASVFKLCRQLKEWNDNVRILIYAENPRNRIQIEDATDSGVVDYVIYGEAEIPFTALVQAMLDGRPVAGKIPNLICFKPERTPSKAAAR